MSGIPSHECPIWEPGYPAKVQIRDTVYPGGIIDGDSFVEVMSERAGGAYSFWMGVYPHFHYPVVGHAEDAAFKARLTTLLVDQRALGVVCPEITRDIVESAKSKRPLQVYERANRLLQFMANTKLIGQEVTPIHEVIPGALAWSESTTEDEITLILDYLVQKGFLNRGTAGEVRYKVTLEGHAHLESLASGVNSNQAFVAMWFDDSMKEAYSKGIEPAIREAGYDPLRIDQEQFLTKIDDAIIAEIRRSAFVVADFTHGDDGQRGSVYYEAGFAHGLNIPVIFLCRESEGIDNLLAFDTRQYAHILWKDEEDLRRKLLHRIRAVILRQ